VPVVEQRTELERALRRIGIVPGPGLLNEDQLARPVIPKGPIPTVRVPNVLPGSGGNGSASTGNGSTVQAPRD